MGSFSLNTQHWGDSFKLMPYVQDGWVDMVLYSPPYITGKGYEDDTSSGIAAYKDASDRMFAEVARVLKPTGVFALEVGYFQHPSKGLDPQLWQGKNTTRPMMYELWPILERYGLHLVREIVWHFRGGRTGNTRSDRHPFNRHEYIAILSPDPANIHFSKEELRDLENNVSYSKLNNKFGAAPTSIWSDESAANARLREIARSLADGRATKAETRLAATETLANLLAPGVTGAVDELMRLATKLKPGAPRHAKALLETNKVIGDTFWNDETSWLIERVTGSGSWKYHECPFPPGLVDNAIRLFCPPGGVVLDPYAGSCMSGKGALMAGRQFLAFERDEYWRTAVTNELKYLKWLLSTWLAKGTEGLARIAPDAPDKLPDPPCPDALTYAGDDLDLRLRCLHARRAIRAFYLDKMGSLVGEMRQNGDLPEKGSKHKEVISESGLCSCSHCQTWLR